MGMVAGEERRFRLTRSYASIDYLELVMPRYAIRGGDVILKCNHSVPPEQLYKVEWQKAGTKIFQYIKGRSPPFRFFTTSGAELNKNYSNEKQLQLSKLDFSASGLYSCVVSMETPIFSKDSESHMLTVIEPQNRDPIVTFNKGTYEIGEILLANCTTAPARPPPHITWLINGEKVIFCESSFEHLIFSEKKRKKYVT
ncbi:PREDICTED: nectin-1-like, partial [Nicrophorus vespilloides]|uniref:Nectin-1-like n=1 Tax=Nicrophorus vespilloides TaxID=110193 RepID=A0ABM1M4L6_NICVS